MPEITDTQHREYLSFLALNQSPADITAKFGKLEKDNQKQRDEIRERDEKLKALPAEGAKVLTKEEAEEWEAFQALKLKPKQVEETVAERDTLKAKVEEREKRDALSKAVATEGWADESIPVLHKLLGSVPLELKTEDVEVTKDGKKTKESKPVGYVTVEGKAVRLSAWAESEGLPATFFTASTAKTTGDWRPAPEQRGNGGASSTTERTAEDHSKAVRAKVDYSV